MATLARVPLMADRDLDHDHDYDHDHDHDNADADFDPAVVDADQDDDTRGLTRGDGAPESAETPTAFVWLLTLAAAISGLLFGCRQAMAPVSLSLSLSLSLMVRFPFY